MKSFSPNPSMDSFAHQQRNHFLFASPGEKAPSTARKVHLRRLRDILHLSIQRGDHLLARRAFGLLARCPEIEWVVIWKFGLVLLATNSPSGNILGTTKHIDFLRIMMLQHPEEVGSVQHFSFSFRAQHSPLIPPHPTRILCLKASDLLLPHVSARIACTGAGVIPCGGRTGARCSR